MRVLVVDSDSLNREFLSFAFNRRGWVSSCCTPAEASQGLGDADFDLVVLCVLGETAADLEVCRRLRASCPACALVVIASAWDAKAELAFFEAGVDDFIVKPFDPQVLLARCLACCRRAASARVSTSQTFPLVRGELTILLDGQVLMAGKRVALSKREYRLLVALAEKAGQVVGREYLLQECGDSDGERDSNQINVYISRLRRKLERDPARPKLILTLRGRGYALSTEENY